MTIEAKRIIYHLRTQGSGSEGIHVRGMVTAFRKQGYEVDFVWPLGEGDPTARAGDNPYDKKKRQSTLEYIVTLIPGPIFALAEFFYNFWAIRKFKRKLEESPCAFIYERHFFFSFASGWIAKRYRIPVVVEVNEIAGYERVRGNHLVGLARACERYLFRNASVISVVSNFLRNAIVERYPEVPPGKIHVIPNGVVEDMFAREVDGRAVRRRYGIEDEIVFGFIGFFLHVQSWHYLEWFVSEFISAVRDRPEIVLMLVGDGPGRKNLEEIGRSNRFSERLIFTGSVSNREIGEYICAMDVGVIPHSNEYRSPIKMFEYMAYGKPVLAPSQEPIRAVLGDIQGKYLFETKDGRSLRHVLAEMIGERERWDGIGKALKESVRKNYTYEKFGLHILDILRNSVDRSGQCQ